MEETACQRLIGLARHGDDRAFEALIEPLLEPSFRDDGHAAAERLRAVGRARYRRGMRTLHTAYRVTDLAASLDFYTAVGYELVGSVDIGGGTRLAMLKFPSEAATTLELVHRPAGGPVDVGTGFSHLVVQVDDLVAAREALLRAGLKPEPVERPGGPDGPQTAWLVDPDGYRIELVQWPPGHPDGITAADFGETARG